MKRIQRKRAKGWVMPPDAVSITRPGKYGNPFKESDGYTHQQCVDNFRECLENPHMAYKYFSEIQSTLVYDHFVNIQKNIHKLKGKKLACFCPENEICHGDVYLEILSK